MKTSDYEFLSLDIDGPVARITLNRPDAFNAFNEKAMDEFLHCLAALQDNQAVRVVVLAGAGKHFCVGLDLGENAQGLAGLTIKQGLRLQQKGAAVMRNMRRIPQPIITLVHGAACGVGFSLALASDIRIAADNARFNAAYIRIGLGGADVGSSYLLPRLVGMSVASELLLTGNFINAERALAVNLVSAVVTSDELLDAAQPYIESMLATSPLGLRLTKDALNISVDAPSMEAAQAIEDRQQLLLGQTQDHAEAVQAFHEKRPPQYRDE